MKVRFWQDWAIAAVAVWLYLSPFVLGIATLSNPATDLAWVCAVVLMISASEALVVPDVIEEWVNVVAGVVLVAGPWIFGFGGELAPTINSVAVGAVVTACAISALVRGRRMSATGA